MFSVYNNSTSHAGIVAMLTMFEQLHGKHTRAVNHIWTTTPVVDFGDDVVDMQCKGMQPLLTLDH